MSEGFLQDPIFFYAVAYVIFFALAWKFGRKPMFQWIDGEIAKVRDELEEARKIRADAEAALTACKAKKAAALAEAEAILRHAREEAERLQAEATEGLKFVLARHEKHTLERIRLMEEEAVAAVRAAIVEQAMVTVRKALAGRMDESGLARMVDKAIAEMPRLKADKAEAA